MQAFRKKTAERQNDNLYSKIVDDIRLSIRNGDLKVGDKLLPERELAIHYDVSRVPVREALKILEFLGVIEQVRGKGVFIKKIEMKQVLSHIDFMIKDPEAALVDLFEAREAIETQAVYLAAIRHTEEDLALLQEAVIEMQINIELGKEVEKASVKFHTAVIAASHNQVLITINDLLSDLLSLSRQYSLKDPKRHTIALNYHRNIFIAIRDKDPEKAKALMYEHLTTAHKVVSQHTERTE